MERARRRLLDRETASIAAGRRAPRPLAPAWRRALPAGGLGGLLGVLALLLWQAVDAFAANARAWLPYPYPRPGSEGLMLYETLLLRRGGNLYGPITPAQFISGPYPPIYYWLAGQVMPAMPGFFDGRSLSLWAAVGAAACAIGIVGWESWNSARSTAPGHVAVHLAAGLAAGGLWLAAPPVLIWATRFRADMLMMGLMAAGLLCVAAGAPPAGAPPHAWRGRRAILLGLAVPLFVLALFTKQTALAGPLAAALFLVLRDWRRGLAWIGTLGALGGLAFLLLDRANDGWFYQKMVVYHSLPWSPATFGRLLAAWQEDHLLLIGAALAYAGWTLVTRRNSLVTWYLLITLALLPTAGVVGADHNHLLPVDLALALASGAGLAAAGSRLLAAPSRGRTAAGLVLVAGLLAAIGYLAMAAQPADWYGPDLAMPGPAEQTQLRKIVALVRAAPPGLYLADDPGVLALAGKTTPYDDLFTTTALAAAGRWDPSTLQDQLRRGVFPLIILDGDVSEPPRRPLRADILTPAMQDAMRAGYERLYADVLFTFAPRH